MQIIDTNLQFGGLRGREKTALIVIHHSASGDVAAEEIHRWHRAKGWAGIGYHFVIRRDGSIERGRPQEMKGAHAGAGVNEQSIGICLAGNFMLEPPPDVQLLALVELAVWLKSFYCQREGSEPEIKLHREIAATACPGDKFPTEQVAGLLQLAMEAEKEKKDGELNAEKKNGNEQFWPDWKTQVMQRAQAAGLIKEEHHPDEPAPKWFVLTVVLNALSQ